jgi:hypothetical protein
MDQPETIYRHRLQIFVPLPGDVLLPGRLYLANREPMWTPIGRLPVAGRHREAM